MLSAINAQLRGFVKGCGDRRRPFRAGKLLRFWRSLGLKPDNDEGLTVPKLRSVRFRR